MIPLPRELVKSVRYTEPRFDASPIQSGLGRDPWKVIVSSILLQRVKRRSDVHQRVLTTWPTPLALSMCDRPQLIRMLSPLGFQHRRASQLISMSFKYHENAFEDVRDLPGCGPYVVDAVGLFCFGNTELESTDGVLREYANSYIGPSVGFNNGCWHIAWLDANREFAEIRAGCWHHDYETVTHVYEGALNEASSAAGR